MINVLFVCLGNICRSPVAEGIFQEKVMRKGLENRISCDSAGTSAFHIGEAPDLRSTANAKKNGIILTHRARQLVKEDAKDFQYILAMDSSNLENITHLLRQEGEPDKMGLKIYLMRDFDPIQDSMDVPDPYYGGSGGFQKVFDILDRSCKAFLNQLIQDHALL